VPGEETIPCWGWQKGWADDVIFALNRWNWSVKADDVERFKAAKFALFEAENSIVGVAEINRVVSSPKNRRYTLEGSALTSGPMRDRWIGKKSPVEKRTQGGVDFCPDTEQ
jgi:hypothetical protein